MKKNKSQTSQSFPSYFFRLSLPCSHRYSLMCASVLLFSCMHPLSYSPGIPSLISLALLLHLFHPSVSSRERHTTRLRRVLSAPCGASNSGTDFFLAGFRPSTPSLPDALTVSLPHTLFHATAEGLSRPPNAPLRYPPSCLLEALT